jgi:hypothetical protein
LSAIFLPRKTISLGRKTFNQPRKIFGKGREIIFLGRPKSDQGCLKAAFASKTAKKPFFLPD